MYVKLRGEEVRAWRVSRDLSRREFAEVTGVGESTLANLERGTTVRLSTARKVAGVMGVEPKSLGLLVDAEGGEAVETAIVEPIRRTAFGRVLSELVESRGIPATPGRIGLLAERAGVDGWKVINAMASRDSRWSKSTQPLSCLAKALEFTPEERERVAMALAWDED